jgi:TolB-like protein
MSDRWAQLRPLFDELVELDEPARAARLHAIGSRDAELRERLEALLSSDESGEQPFRERVESAARALEADPLGLAGTKVARYRIDTLIGVGGMGVVYRATDVRLGRVAAVKLLPPGLRLNPHAKERFLNEARAASSLDHPNVCTVYEADEVADGTVYLAMPCYEGETLRDRLERGILPIDEALDLARQAARGLAAAHARGLVHRDIKPANLFITSDGTLKILDFGIAKIADVGLTQPDQRPGTAAYMAPEQARGETVDGRADLWSLGMVLYEMLTGRRPAGAAAGAEVPPPSSLRAGVPRRVDLLISSMLAMDPDDRPLRAEAVVAVLEEGRMVRRRPSRVASLGLGVLVALAVAGSYVYVVGGPPTPAPAATSPINGPRSLAVLPFANASPEVENDFFTDGVTEDILTHLAQVPELSVISRGTSMGFKGTAMSVREIADELGVQYVLEGSVRRLRNHVRITAQLVDGRTDQQLWAGSYDHELEDIFAVQTEIARAIVSALEVELSASVATRIERPPTDNLEAYDVFLLGRESLYRYDPEGIEGAMTLFERALAMDPNFALARAWLGRALAMYVHNQGLGPAWVDSAVAVARHAIADQPDLPDAHTALGTALWSAGRYQAGISAFQRALRLNPNDAIATHNLGALSAWRGAFDEAIRLYEGCLEGPHANDPAILFSCARARFYNIVLQGSRASTAIRHSWEC